MKAEPAARREPLSRERITDAAMAIADAGGLDAVTIRGLGRALHVEPMSLYHYAASRDEIVSWLVDRVVDQIELPSAASTWRAGLRACAVSAHAVLRQHPWACRLLMSGPRISAPRLQMVDAMLATLAKADLPPELADLAYHAVDSHILGFTMWEAGYSSGMPLTGEELQAFLRDIQIERYPNLQAHAAWHLHEPAPVRVNEFDFKLDLILDGIERLGDTGWTPSHAEPRGASAGT